MVSLYLLWLSKGWDRSFICNNGTILEITWAYQLIGGGQRHQRYPGLRKGLCRNWKGGRRTFLIRPERKCSSRQSFKQFRLTLCPWFGCPNPFVTLFALWWPAFGGNLKERRGVFIGGSGQLSPPAKKMEGWGLENLNI